MSPRAARPTIRPPLPDPPVHADEKTTLTAFLDWYRDVILRKVEGLSKEQAARRLVDSPTTLLGIVKHLAYVERGWFQGAFMGERVERLRTKENPDAEFEILPDDTVEDIVDLYRGEIEHSRQIVDAASLDDRARATDRHYSLRWIVVHVIEETARHAGHADILRELTDGATGE